VSAESTNGHSLNDTLLIGPTLQQDLFSIMLRFCTHQIVFTANSEMYRKSGFIPQTQDCNEYCKEFTDNTDLQTPDSNIWDCTKNFLVTACLKKLMVEEREKYPQTTTVLFTGFPYG
jgi:hypothetical protein